MTDDKKTANAVTVYNALCKMLDENEVNYEKHGDDLVVSFVMSGEDLPMQFIIKVDAERELIRMLSPIPVVFGEDKRVEGALAVCRVNYLLADGNFDYDYKSGKVNFRLTSSYTDSLISGELLGYMVAVTGYTVEKYNDKFFMLSRGQIPIEDFFKD